LREKLAILGEKGYTALTGNEPGYEARDLINRYTGLADLLDVPGIALSASDAARSIGTRQYPQAVADVAGMALGAIPIAGPALKGAGKKVVKKGAEAAARTAEDLASKYLTEEGGRQRPYLPAGHFRREENLAKHMEGSATPPVLYHGTVVHPDQVFGNITSFDPKYATKTLGRREGMDQIGSWFSETPAGSRDAVPGAGLYSGGEGVLYPVHASIKNPWRPSNFDEFLDAMHIAAGRDPKIQNPRGVGSIDELRKKLIDEGYDGIYFSQNLDHPDQPPTWVALHPERQVKSAIGNRGTFDPNEPDITKARGGVVNASDLRYKYGIE